MNVYKFKLFIIRVLKLAVPKGLYSFYFRKHVIINKNMAYNKINYDELQKKFNFKQIYLSDDILGMGFYSYTETAIPENIFWNRHNAFIPIHFYGHRNIGKTIGNPFKKYAIIVETESIDPVPYHRLLRREKLALSYDAIFTHSKEILDKYENAYFIPAGGIWYKNPVSFENRFEELIELKNKGVSIVSSNKNMSSLHKYRIKLSEYCKTKGIADTFGNFDGGNIVSIDGTLTKYRYSIVIENTIAPYCFTEKILNCFASYTVPIYLGASDIGKFFNKDGIIILDANLSFDEIERIINNCNLDDYKNRLVAIHENFIISQKFACQEDFIMKNYGNMFNQGKQ